MFAELFQGSALLGFTVSALVIFILVFAAIWVRTLRTPRAVHERHARLVLDEEVADER